MARKFGVKDGKNRKWYGIERPTKDGFNLIHVTLTEEEMPDGL